MRYDSMARKKRNTCYILETVQLWQKKKDISCYILEIVQLIPILKKTAATYWYPSSYFSCVLPKYAALTLGLNNSSCESDEYTEFDVFLTPPNKAWGTMHCTSFLGFHISFKELVKREKIYMMLRVCLILVQWVVCCSLLAVMVCGEAWLSACRAPHR